MNDDAALEDSHLVTGIGVDRRASKETLQPKVPWQGRTQLGDVVLLPGQAMRLMPVREKGAPPKIIVWSPEIGHADFSRC